ncbi:MAG: hypothetical protein GY787_33225 [Alteromonadales bacterium]|nr:hypothetical protein [Alteromonadales bacterium]
MAHFAELDENNIVTRVIVVHNNELVDTSGNESEAKGVEFCSTLFGHTNWVQTSYNNNMRKQFAGIGYTYDSDSNVFIAPQPYPSWSLDDNSDWQPPTPMPEDDNMYSWNEDTQSWDLVEPINDDTE